MSNIQIKITQGGFSEPILQPIYLISTAMILFLNMHFSLFWSSVIIIAPLFFVAWIVARKQGEYDTQLMAIAYNIYARTGDNYFPNYWELRYFVISNNQISTKDVQEYFNVTRYKARIIKDELVKNNLLSQKESTASPKNNKQFKLSDNNLQPATNKI